MSAFELDHVFVFVKPGGPEAELLARLGLKEGVRRTHKGQGTSNVSFFFRNAYLELIWASDEEEIRSEVARPLLLWERSRWREDAASPFGLCFRPTDPKRRPPLEHPLGLRELTEVRVSHPGAEPLSAEWVAPEAAGLVAFAGGAEYRLELVFDGGKAGKTRELAPRLPLALSW